MPNTSVLDARTAPPNMRAELTKILNGIDGITAEEHTNTLARIEALIASNTVWWTVEPGSNGHSSVVTNTNQPGVKRFPDRQWRVCVWGDGFEGTER